MAERLYSATQVADLVGATPEMVQGWIASGWIRTESLPGGLLRVSERGLVRFLRDRGVDLAAVLDAASRPAPSEDVSAEAPPPSRASNAGPDAAAAAAKLADAILRDAAGRRADAVHLEPRDQGLALVLDIDGARYEKPRFMHRLPGPLTSALPAHFASQAHSVIEAAGRRWQVRAGPEQHRVSVHEVPPRRSLEALGFGAPTAAALAEIAAAPDGLVLVVGAPGSGRTTTLRALSALATADGRRALALAEGPTFEVDGLPRLPPDATGVGTAMQRPEGVLIIDPVADGPTAAIAVRAVAMGRLVLASTETPALEPDAGLLAGPPVDAAALATALHATLVQRLVRTVCPECRTPAAPDADALRALGVGGNGSRRNTARGRGCAACRKTGYRGRTALVSGLQVTDAVVHTVTGDAGDADILWPARSLGAASLVDAGRRLVLSGVTTAEEVVRVLELA